MKKGEKREETGRNRKNRETEEKNKTKGQNHDLPFVYFVDF